MTSALVTIMAALALVAGDGNGSTKRGDACVVLDTGANVATYSGHAYRYRDMGEHLAWQAGTPTYVQAMALQAIDAQAQAGTAHRRYAQCEDVAR